MSVVYVELKMEQEKGLKICKSWGDVDPKTKVFKDKRAYKRSKNKEIIQQELEDEEYNS